MAKVNRLWNVLMPFATDSSGVCSLFCDSDSVVIGLDPGATTVRCYPFTERRKDKKARYKGMRIGELDAVMGKMDETTERLRRLTEEDDAEQNVILGTPVASMVGVDLKALAKRLENDTGRVTFGVTTTGNRYYDEGLSDAFRVIYERIKKDHSVEKNIDSMCFDLSDQEKNHHRIINLLGWNTLDYPEEKLRKNILEHLEKHQFRIGSIWGLQSSLENWSRVFEADGNVVCSASGYRLAVKMKKDTGMPFIFLDELLEKTAGLFLGADDMVVPEKTRRILIIGEQIVSNGLRRKIRISCRDKGDTFPEIVCAGFFQMHNLKMESQDVRLKSEDDLKELLINGGFDLVIGDPMFRLMEKPEVTHISRIHPPISGSFAEQFAE